MNAAAFVVGDRRAGRLVARAEAAFSRCAADSLPGLRNHCDRVFWLAQALIEQQGCVYSQEVLYCIALCHDLGLLALDVAGNNYLERSLNLVRCELSAEALNCEQWRIAEQCLLFNHRLRPVVGLHGVARAFRQAVWVEHTRGVRRYGLERQRVRDIFARYPRQGFDVTIARFAGSVLLHEPSTIVRGIFF